jgi:hypothetical protein
MTSGLSFVMGATPGDPRRGFPVYQKRGTIEKKRGSVSRLASVTWPAASGTVKS